MPSNTSKKIPVYDANNWFSVWKVVDGKPVKTGKHIHIDYPTPEGHSISPLDATGMRPSDYITVYPYGV